MSMTKDLSEVLKTLEEAKIYWNQDKHVFAKPVVMFLGYIKTEESKETRIF